MITNQEFFEIDDKKKDSVWGDKMISHFRNKWNPLVDPNRAKKGMEYLLTLNDLGNIKKMFEDPQNIGFNFAPIAVMEKLRNIIIAERNSAGVYITLNSIDTSAVKEKNNDYKLLKNRADMEGVMSQLQAQIGLPEYKLENTKDEKGKSLFKGNVDQFDELHLDDAQGYHIDYFFQTHYKLRHEIRGQEIVNYFVRYNELKNNIDLWCNDIMAKKAIALRTFLNENTGAIEYKYLAPEKVKLIKGRKKDGKDCPAIGYEEEMTVADFIRLVGNSFDWERDLPDMLTAVNQTNATDFTGVYNQENITGEPGRVCSYGDFLEYRVAVGYIEFKTINADAYKVGKNFHGNFNMIPVPPTLKISKDSVYQKESFYNEMTYKAFYLIHSTTSQRLFKYGPLFCQDVEGAEDEYSNFSILVRKEEGPTVAEVSEPFIEIVQESFYKFKWFVRKAKPKGRIFGYDSLVEVAKKVIASGDTATDIHKIIQMWEDGINEIYTYPKVNGQPIGGGAQPNFDKPNGLDPTAMKFSEIIDWAVNQISDKLGISPLAEAYSPSPNDGYKLQMQALQQSRKATDYMSRMIMSMLESAGKFTLNATQSILKYKMSKPYKFLEKAVGGDVLADLEDMDGYAFHRYGIFIDSFNNDQERQEIKAATQDAWVKGEITYETMLMVNGVDDPKKAGMVLSFEKFRKDQEKKQEAQQAQDNLMQLENQKHKNELDRIDRKGQYEIQGKNIEGEWYYKALKAGADAKIQAQEIRNDSEPAKVATKTQAEIDKERAKAQIKAEQAT